MPPKRQQQQHTKLVTFLGSEIGKINASIGAGEQSQSTQATSTTTSKTLSNNNNEKDDTQKQQKKTTPSAKRQKTATPKFSEQQWQQYSAKKQVCKYREYSSTERKVIHTSKGKNYLASVTLSYEVQEEEFSDHMLITKGAKIELFGHERMQIVAGVSKPIGGSIHTLYHYTIHTNEIRETSILDITKYITVSSDPEDLVAADAW